MELSPPTPARTRPGLMNSLSFAAAEFYTIHGTQLYTVHCARCVCVCSAGTLVMMIDDHALIPSLCLLAHQRLAEAALCKD